MNPTEGEFFEKLMGIFREEADEHLKALSDGLLELEQHLPIDRQQKVLETIFREAHSLKGAARSVQQQSILEICQSLETVLSLWKEDKIEISAHSFDSLHATINTITTALTTPLDLNVVDKTIWQLKALTEKKSDNKMSDPPSLKSPKKSTGETNSLKWENHVSSPKEQITSGKTIRVSLEKMSRLFQEVEETLMIKHFFKQQLIDLKRIQSEGLTQAHLNKVLKNTELHSHLVETTIDALLEDLKQLLMQPMSTLFETLPHMIRDISRDLAKEVHVEFQGGDIEVDRRVLEEIKDPIVHLIRNAIAHGIESPQERVERQKSPTGIIRIVAAESEGNKVKVSISDDGYGININSIKQAALIKGIISQDELVLMSDEQAIKLAFHSDISTSPIITEISGRGVGLGIVSEKVDKLGGQTDIISAPNYGTTFTLTLPLSLAAFRGILISVSGQNFVLPTHYIKKAVRIKALDIKTVENRETIVIDDHSYSFVHLADLLGIAKTPASPEENNYLFALIMTATEQTIVLGADYIHSEQEILVKKLGKQHIRVKNIMAATLLETGQIIPILNPVDLIKSAIQGIIISSPSAKSKDVCPPKKSILVVEDSITTRLLLNDILTSEDYEVTTAFDGAEAFDILQNQTFDLLVTDVEMPRMNGFELTEKVRKMQQANDLPIIICTGLGSREDRERGIELGANAYLDKSSFDNQSFINIVKKLI